MIDEFPSRKEILEGRMPKTYRDTLVQQVKDIEVEKIDFDNSDFKPRNKIVEKQKEWRWTRLFTKEEVQNLQVNDTILIKHLPTGQKLESQFICFAKKNLERDSDGNIVAFQGEEDKKILCLMIDIERLADDSLSFIRTLFQNTKWYEYQLLRRDELIFENQRTKEKIEYFDVTF